MSARGQRLKDLLELQERLKRMHEMRRAGHLASAAAATREIDEVMARRSDDGSLSDLFPDVYARFVDRAHDRRRAEETAAEQQAREVARQTMRAKVTARELKAEQDVEDRRLQERDALEAVERKLRS